MIKYPAFPLRRISILFVLPMFIFVTTATAQYKMDQVLRVGYKLGMETFNPAYSVSTFDIPSGKYINSTRYKDHMPLRNLEVWYCRYSPFVFYEASLDGIGSALVNYIKNDRHEYEGHFKKFKNCSKNGAAQVNGIDYDVFNFKLAFGAKGIYFGGQYKFTRLGSFTDDLPGSIQVTQGIGHSETNLTSVGLGLHANISVKTLVTQTHLMLNWVNGKPVNTGEDPLFKGKEIEIESIISYGKAFGGYITPFFKKRFGKDYTTFNQDYYRGFSGSFAFGIKIGFYLAQESDEGDVYISVAD
jgi:hypothetical protein